MVKLILGGIKLYKQQKTRVDDYNCLQYKYKFSYLRLFFSSKLRFLELFFNNNILYKKNVIQIHPYHLSFSNNITELTSI